jgi:predicted DNA binding CopG/RHH family protein
MSARRDLRIDTRVTEAEFDRIRARAARLGLGVSAYIRMAALCPDAVRTTEEEANELGRSE